MEATIEIGGVVAFIKDYHWQSEEPWLANLLNGMLDEFGPSPADPQPEVNEARRVVKELGGSVLDEKLYTYDEPGVVY